MQRTLLVHQLAPLLPLLVSNAAAQIVAVDGRLPRPVPPTDGAWAGGEGNCRAGWLAGQAAASSGSSKRERGWAAQWQWPQQQQRQLQQAGDASQTVVPPSCPGTLPGMSRATSAFCAATFTQPHPPTQQQLGAAALSHSAAACPATFECPLCERLTQQQLGSYSPVQQLPQDVPLLGAAGILPRCVPVPVLRMPRRPRLCSQWSSACRLSWPKVVSGDGRVRNRSHLLRWQQGACAVAYASSDFKPVYHPAWQQAAYPIVHCNRRPLQQATQPLSAQPPSAPSNACTASALPLSAASISGVRPSSVSQDGSAPSRSSCTTRGPSPAAAAAIRRCSADASSSAPSGCPSVVSTTSCRSSDCFCAMWAPAARCKGCSQMGRRAGSGSGLLEQRYRLCNFSGLRCNMHARKQPVLLPMLPPAAARRVGPNHCHRASS